MDKIEKAQTSSGLTGVPSGYTSIDRLTMGWQKGNLIILGARPSVGKTAFALNLARNAAVEFNRPIAFFSLEMQDVEILQRLLVAESGIPGDKVSGKSKMANDDWIALESGLSRLIQAPIYIDETPQIPITEFASKAKHLVREKGVEMIFVDYLQLMKGESSQQSFREQEVASISRSLKGLAKELDIPIMALSQLSRGIMNRAGSNGRPVLSDLRESGSIEQDADIVVFIHRPEAIGFTDQETMSETNTEIIFAKHRNGELATIPMDFVGEYVRFYELGQSLKLEPTVTYESRMNQSSVNTSNSEFDVNG
ncbi:MAG: DnaB-like helicase C-terminal domain-containing protein [Bacteroidales bacterium]|nr:DnaB-like helicase C-terminal domain-containing protein [Bacteroidales bacterium]